MERYPFSVKVQGFTITGHSTKDAEGKLELENMKLDLHTQALLSATFNQDEKAYWDFIDEICIALDRTKLFDFEVYSDHIQCAH